MLKYTYVQNLEAQRIQDQINALRAEERQARHVRRIATLSLRLARTQRQIAADTELGAWVSELAREERRRAD